MPPIGWKRHTFEYLLVRVNAVIGHIKLEKIQPRHLKEFYTMLKKEDVQIQKERVVAKPSLSTAFEKKNITKSALSEKSGTSLATVRTALQEKPVAIETATRISEALEMAIDKLFEIQTIRNPLSDKTILEHHRVIKAILNSAYKEQIIPKNVADFVEPPKVRRKEAVFLEEKEAQQVVYLLMNKEKDIRKKTAFLLLLFSGMRRGELCGLTWDCVDEQANTIFINKESQYQKGKGTVLKETKTESSIRTVQLPPVMFVVLEEYREWWEGQRKCNGSRWKDESGLLLIGEDGSPLFPQTINRWLKTFTEEHDLPHFTPHAFRHTFASLQLANGVDVATLKKRTGHSQAGTLLNVYSHAIKSKEQTETDSLERLLLGDNEVKDSKTENIQKVAK